MGSKQNFQLRPNHRDLLSIHPHQQDRIIGGLCRSPPGSSIGLELLDACPLESLGPRTQALGIHPSRPVSSSARAPVPGLQPSVPGKKGFPKMPAQLPAPQSPCDQVAEGVVGGRALEEQGCPPEAPPLAAYVAGPKLVPPLVRSQCSEFPRPPGSRCSRCQHPESPGH